MESCARTCTLSQLHVHACRPERQKIHTSIRIVFTASTCFIPKLDVRSWIVICEHNSFVFKCRIQFSSTHFPLCKIVLTMTPALKCSKVTGKPQTFILIINIYGASPIIIDIIHSFLRGRVMKARIDKILSVPKEAHKAQS